MTQLDPKIVEQMADAVDVISKAAVGMRASLERGGFSEGAAEVMAVQFYQFILRAVFEPR